MTDNATEHKCVSILAPVATHTQQNLHTCSTFVQLSSFICRLASSSLKNIL